MSAGSAGTNPSDYLGPLEARIMDDVWEHGASKVNDVQARLNEGQRRPLAYNTVMTTLVRLAEKGYLIRQRDGRAYVYAPRYTKEGFLRHHATVASQELVEDLRSVAVAGFFDSIKTDPELVEELAQLLREHRGDM